MMVLDPLPPQPGSESGAARHASAAPRRLVRWATAASLLPIPLWFAASALLAPAPAWRAEYRANSDFSGEGIVIHERELSRYWDKTNTEVPGNLSRRRFFARWDTCLSLAEARDIPVMLAADGVATFAVDGVERLRAESATLRATRGDVIRFEAGSHHLRVQLQPRAWPSIALLASLDGEPPRPLGSGELAAGVRTHRPAEGSDPCGAAL